MLIRVITLIIIATIIISCGESDNSSEDKNLAAKEKLAEKFGLTLFEMDNGVGPIKEELKVGNIDNSLAETGKNIFISKCAQCHKIDERYTGPALRGVTDRRSPAYIMNMILNPEEMTKRHPEAKKMLAIYANQMTFQNVTKEDARALLEYLRTESSNKK